MEEDRLIRVIEVEADFDYQSAFHQDQTVMVRIPKIECKLEDGRVFTLWHVPLEIVRAIRKMKGIEEDVVDDERQSLFDILPYFQKAAEEMGKAVERVTIDDEIRIDELGGVVYKATLELNLDMMKVKIPMIPSHAVFLALVTDKPIYVSERLVKEQEDQGEENGT